MHTERRKFHRIEFEARVEIAQGDKHWQAQLIDISLRGMLLAKLAPYEIQTQLPLLVKVILSDQTTIAMTAQVVNQTIEQLRLACSNIDLDSICHLRRLIELNIGDAKAADREICELISE